MFIKKKYLNNLFKIINYFKIFFFVYQTINFKFLKKLFVNLM